MKKLFIRWTLVLLCGAVIFYLSSMQISAPPVQIDHIDLVAHACMYALFALLLSLALRVRIQINRRWVALLVVIVSTGYGALMEWYQSYLPFRSMELNDGIANAFGAMLGLGAYQICAKLFKESTNVSRVRK